LPLPFSLQVFFRRVPNELLREYFEGRDELRGFEWDRFTLSATDPLHDAWRALPEASRDQTECELHAVHDFATHEGLDRLREQGLAHGVDLAPQLAARGDVFDRAFFVFLRCRRVFDAARQLHRVDHLDGRSWRTRADLPRRDPDVTPAVRSALGDAVAAYFRKKGAGAHCDVQDYRRGDKRVLVAYPQDVAEAVLGYESGKLREKAERPVFQVVFSFDPGAGTLDLHVQGGARVHRDLQQIFSRVVLGEELPDDPGVVTPYRLNPLKHRGFAFPLEPADGVREVRVKALRLAVLGRGARIGFDAGPLRERTNVYDLMEGSLRTDGLPLSNIDVDDVTMQMVFAHDQGPRILTFGMTKRSCELRDGPEHAVARRCLKRWEIACA
jgi:hypothetical protein